MAWTHTQLKQCHKPRRGTCFRAMSTGSSSSSSGLVTVGSAAVANGTVAASTASSLTSRAAALAGGVTTENTESLGRSIERFKGEQARLRADRKRVAKELRNASKRKSRLRKRARQLSNDDLVAVLLMRKNTEEEESTTTEAVAAGAANEIIDGVRDGVSEMTERF